MTESEKHQLLKDIEQSVKIFQTAARFTEYSKVYPYTNENLIKKYSLIIEGDYQTALTVLSSGDHLLNLVMNGTSHIDTFDSNKMTEYYVMGIKIPAILNMTYEQYMKFYKTLLRPGINEDKIFAVVKGAEEKYKYFWEEFYRIYYDQNNLRFDFENLFISEFDRSHFNKYLRSSSDYQKMQSCLKDATITFKHADVTTIPLEFKTYDLIDISNILNYYETIFKAYNYPREERKKLVAEIVSKNLIQDGVIFYDYFLGTGFYEAIRQTRAVMIENTSPFSVECTNGLALGLTKNKK
ncbi:MAG: hypothetical protein IJO33_04610 [Bacilli bacterium]|nr:hypothetical protein [Bacilli bacterium]